MKFELKSVEYSPSLSEETYCFSAKLYINDVHAFDVSNRGHGGPTDAWKTGRSPLTESTVNEYLAENPPADWEYDFGYDIEMKVNDLLSDWIAKQHLNRLLSRFVIATDGTNLFSFKYKGGLTSNKIPKERTQEMIDTMKKKDLELVTKELNYERALALV